MKTLLCSAALALLIAAPASAQTVSLVGTWVGERDRMAKVEGRRAGQATLVITEQQGHAFKGHLKRSNTTGDEEEPLWGASAPDGRLMMGADRSLQPGEVFVWPLVAGGIAEIGKHVGV